MFTIINSISERALPYETNAKKGCKITKAASAILATLGLGAAAFSAIFFTAHLLIPSLATSISLVVLLGGVDACILICCKRNTNSEINLLGDQPPYNPENPAEQLYEEALFEDSDEEIGKNIQQQIQENDPPFSLATNQELNPLGMPKLEIIEKDIPIAQVFAINDLVLEIFKFLNIKDLYKLQLVCKQWKECSDKVLQLKFVQILEKTKHLRGIILSEEELHLYTVFLMNPLEKTAQGKIDDIRNAAYYKRRQLTWNNYIVTKSRDGNFILIENLQDPKICHEIKRPIPKKIFTYSLMNGYLVLKYSDTAIKLHVWNLKEGSPIVLPETLLEDYNATFVNDIGYYIYKNLLVRNVDVGMFIKIHDLTTGKITKIDVGFKTLFISGYEENIALHLNSASMSQISIFNIETKKMTILSSSKLQYNNLRIALNYKYTVISFTDDAKHNLQIYTKSKKTNKYSKKAIQIPDVSKLYKLTLVNNFLYLQSNSETYILNLSLPKEEIWEKKKSFSTKY